MVGPAPRFAPSARGVAAWVVPISRKYDPEAVLSDKPPRAHGLMCPPRRSAIVMEPTIRPKRRSNDVSRPVQAWLHRRHPRRRRLGTRHHPDLGVRSAHTPGAPDPDDRLVDDAARPGEPCPNLVVAPVYVALSVWNAVGESWTYFFGLAATLEVIVLALFSAWPGRGLERPPQPPRRHSS